MQPKRRFYFYSLVLLSFLLLFGISTSNVWAGPLLQSVTDTPTREPLFKTPTLAPTQNTACPGAMPTNWGTYTPGPLWLAQCYGCMLTLTPAVTGTPAPINTLWVPVTQTAAALTGTPGGTGTPVTPTAFATPGENCTLPTATGFAPTATATGTGIQTKTIQETSWTFSGSWTTETGGGNCSGNCKYSQTNGNYWTWTGTFYTTTTVYIYGLKCTNQGNWDLYVDNVRQFTVNNYASPCTWQTILTGFDVLAGTHTIKAVALGTHNQGTGNFVEFDYFRYTDNFPTPTAGAPGLLHCVSGGRGSCTEISSTELHFGYEGSYGDMGISWGQVPSGVPLQITIIGTYAHTETYGTSQNRVNDELRINSAGGWAGNWSNLPSWCLSGYGTNVTCTASIGQTFTLQQNTYWPVGYLTLYTVAAPDWPASTTYGAWDFEIYLGAVCTQFATATPGAGAGGYCSTVPGSADVDLSDLPNITLGEASCASIGPFTINLSGISWLPGLGSIESAGLPEISLCLREIYFGGVTVFGMRFDLDILSAVITCVLALRWVFRS